MNKQEFEKILGEEVTAVNYAKIEEVYTFHPSISNVGGKVQIANLYEAFGMRIIEDMLPTARRAREMQNEINATRLKLESLQVAYAAFVNCNEVTE